MFKGSTTINRFLASSPLIYQGRDKEDTCLRARIVGIRKAMERLQLSPVDDADINIEFAMKDLCKLRYISDVKAHQIIQVCATTGFIHPYYMSWAKILSKSCGPHKFFEHVTRRKLSLSESNCLFQKLLKQLQTLSSFRVTPSLLENFLCELDRERRNMRKKDIIFGAFSGTGIQSFYRLHHFGHGKFDFVFHKCINGKWSEDEYPFPFVM